MQWCEVVYCATPLAEEREYWEPYFTLDKVQDAHARSRCRDLNGAEPWACSDCDCTARLDAHLAAKGRIVITDRKKDMIVNDKGDNISPQRVEGMLTLQP